MKYSLKQLLTERMTNQAWSFFQSIDGFSDMSRREVPSKEQLNKRRDIYYGRYVDGECQTLFQLEERDFYDYVNNEQVKVIWIHGIRSMPADKCQGKGMGTHVMTNIMQFADSIGIGVAGDVVPYGGSKMTQDDMRAFDARFGLMPMEYYKKFMYPEDLAHEETMEEINDFLSSCETWVWRPAEGSMGL